MLAQMWYALNRRGPRPNNAYPFVVQFVQAPGGVAASVVVIPATGVEGMPFKRLNAWDRRQLGAVERPAGHDHEARPEDIIPIGRHHPTPCCLLPARLFDLRLEAGPLVEVEVPADALGVLKDLG